MTKQTEIITATQILDVIILQWGNNKNYPVAQCKNAASNEFYFEGSKIIPYPGYTRDRPIPAKNILTEGLYYELDQANGRGYKILLVFKWHDVGILR